jgi:hypothetical protein
MTATNKTNTFLTADGYLLRRKATTWRAEAQRNKFSGSVTANWEGYWLPVVDDLVFKDAYGIPIDSLGEPLDGEFIQE